MTNLRPPSNQPLNKQELCPKLVTSRKDAESSQTLVNQALGGDDRLLQFLLDVIRQHLAKRVRFELARRHLYMMEIDQEDLIQDVLIQLWTVDLHRFDASKSSVATFATGRLRWMLIDRIRKQAREHAVSLEKLADANVPDRPGYRQDPASLLEDAAYEKKIANVVAALLSSTTAHNDNQAFHIVKRHHVDNIPMKEIAAEIDRHPANVTRARQRALRYAQVSLKRQTTFFAA